MLSALVEEPGIVQPDAAAAEVVAGVLRAQVRRVRKAARHVDGTDDAYHALRKAARRMRYVAEAVAEAAPGLYPTAVDDLARAGDRLHDALGGHRDSAMFAEHVVREGVLAARAGERSDPYDLIAALARAEAASQLATVPKALRGLRDAASGLP